MPSARLPFRRFAWMTLFELLQETYEVGNIICILPWGNHGTESFPNLPKVTEETSSPHGIQIPSD